jgi:hypothetical protein
MTQTTFLQYEAPCKTNLHDPDVKSRFADSRQGQSKVSIGARPLHLGGNYGPGHVFAWVSLHSWRTFKIASRSWACKMRESWWKTTTQNIPTSLPFARRTMDTPPPVCSGSQPRRSTIPGRKSRQRQSYLQRRAMLSEYGSTSATPLRRFPVLLAEGGRVLELIVWLSKLHCRACACSLLLDKRHSS